MKTMTDQGGEFNSSIFSDFCTEEGIRRQLTTSYTPQHIGMVEIRNRTILDMVRSLLKVKNLPHCFWGEAVNTAVYLLNRAPTKILEGKTPYEA